MDDDATAWAVLAAAGGGLAAFYWLDAPLWGAITLGLAAFVAVSRALE